MVLALEIGASSACAAPAQVSEPPPTEPVASTRRTESKVTGGGVVLDSLLDGSPLVPGRTAVAALRATNMSGGKISYLGGDGGCKLTGLFWIEFPDLRLDTGREWTGARGRIKESVIRGQSEGVSLPSPGQPESGCDLGSAPSTLLPGESVSASGTWDGRLANGYPAPAARYTVNVRFLVLDGPDGETTLRSRLPIDVVEGEDVPPPGRVLDVAFLDPDVVQWLEQYPETDWTRFAFAYVPTRSIYQLTIEEINGAQLTATVGNAGRGPVDVVRTEGIPAP